MKKTEFESHMYSLNLNIEVDNSMRRISEKVRLLNIQRDTFTLSAVVNLLSNLDHKIEEVISNTFKDE